jgi:hypothetical protein
MSQNEYKEGEVLAPDKTVAVVAGQSPSGTVLPIAVNADGEIITEVTVDSDPVPADADLIAAVFVAEGTIAGSAMTGTYASLLALPDHTRAVFLANDTDADVYISFDGGSSNHAHLSTGDRLTINLAEFGLKSTADVQAKDGDTAPASGKMRAFAVRG